jgi:hypothetical protein
MARSLEAFREGFPKRKELELPLFVDQINGDFVALSSPVPYSEISMTSQTSRQPRKFHILTHFVFVEEEMPLCFYQVEGVSSPGQMLGKAR